MRKGCGQPLLRFTHHASRMMPQALNLLMSGRIKVDVLTTHQLGLEGFGEAVRLMREAKSLKVQLLPNLGK
jgi:threonine dehydrogenase-like Zn-dependent dehydrogenase